MEVDTVAWDELRIIRLLEYIATEGKSSTNGAGWGVDNLCAKG